MHVCMSTSRNVTKSVMSVAMSAASHAINAQKCSA